MGLTNKVRRARKKEGLTQVELAAKLGATQAWISEIEKTDSERLQLRTLRRFSKYFKVPIEELFPESR